MEIPNEFEIIFCKKKSHTKKLSSVCLPAVVDKFHEVLNIV